MPGTLTAVKIEYPYEVPAYPSRAGHGCLLTNEEGSLTILEDERLDWLGPLAIELPTDWDGARTDFWFHDDEYGLRTLKTEEPVTTEPTVKLTISMRK